MGEWKMTKDKIVEKGWYRLALTNRQRFTGQCLSIRQRGKTWIQYSFDIGEEETDKIVRKPCLLILHIDDIASAMRLSPRYIEHVESRRGEWHVIRYKGLLPYGEE